MRCMVGSMCELRKTSKVENSIPDSESIQKTIEHTDSKRSARNSKAFLEHSGISRVASRGSVAFLRYRRYRRYETSPRLGDTF